MASKLWVHEPDTFFLFEDTEISEKWNFFVNFSAPENFQVPTESLGAVHILRNTEWGGGLLWKAPIRLLSGPRLINIYGKNAKKPDPSLSPKRLQTSALPIQVDLPRQ